MGKNLLLLGVIAFLITGCSHRDPAPALDADTCKRPARPDAPVQYHLGMMYAHGVLVKKNLLQSIEWFDKIGVLPKDIYEECRGVYPPQECRVLEKMPYAELPDEHPPQAQIYLKQNVP
ncbi:MAG: SEL1-like repeat protein [Sulfuricurvum sp.]|nr:SEL1-like repeat protein [Sulfuricurvum sp.]